MSKKKEDDIATSDGDSRPIPNPPGGGSWTFDHAAFAWVANAPEIQPVEPAQE